MRRGAATWVLFLLLANALMVSGVGGADGAGSGESGRGASRATTLIYNVYDLQNMSLDLKGCYELANDIDASITVNWNNGAGFVPVGNKTSPFNGTLDGKGYKISGLFINRPTTDYIGLFGYAGKNNSVRNLGIVDVNVTGSSQVSALVGYCYYGTVSNTHVSGNVRGDSYIGGLMGFCDFGTVNNSYFGGNLTATNRSVGGLVGGMYKGLLDNSHATGDLNGVSQVGGLLGYNYGSDVNNSWFAGNLSGTFGVGGLIGYLDVYRISNSHYDIDDVSINGGHHITAGGLFGAQYLDWVSNGLALDISDYGGVLVPSGGSYGISDIQGLRALLGFADIPRYKFRLASDMDLSNHPGLHIPLLAAEFDGGNHTISNLSIKMPFSYCTGMFGHNHKGSIRNLGIANSRIEGGENVGGLVGSNTGMVNNSHATGDVAGKGDYVGGLAGYSNGVLDGTHASGNVNGGECVGGLAGYSTGTVNNSYAAGKVDGHESVGGLVGRSYGFVNHSHATNDVTGTGGDYIGGLVGYKGGSVHRSYATGNVNGSGYHTGGLAGINLGLVNSSYSTGNVNGYRGAGGLVGTNEGETSNSHYDVDKVLINGGHHLTIGGLFKAQYDDWFSADLSLDISDYNASLVHSNGYYGIGNVSGLRDLLGFADVTGYRFRLASDIDLANDAGLYIPYLAAEFDGANRTIHNLEIDLSFVSSIGMFGSCRGGAVKNVRLVDLDVRGYCYVGGLAGYIHDGTSVNNSIAQGNVTGHSYIGGLVGGNDRGSLNNIHSSGNVTGTGYDVGGLVGSLHGLVTKAFSNANVNGTGNYVGGLVGSFNHCSMDTVYATGDVTGNYSVGGLVGGMVEGGLSNSFATGNVRGDTIVGGLAGLPEHCRMNRVYATGDVTGNDSVGGLVGCNHGSMYDSYARGDVTGNEFAGGLVGRNNGTVGTSYATGAVTCDGSAGGLAGSGDARRVYGSFWDNETSGQSSSYGGTGMTTAMMKTQSTFNVAGWNFTSTWWMMENVTYPLFLWQNVAPEADAGMDRTIDEDTLATFDASGSQDDVGIVDFTWTFSDGVPVILHGMRPSHQFNEPGIFVVELNVTNAIGNWDTDNLTLTVNDVTPPVPDAGPDRTVDEGTSVTFSGSASHDNGGIVNYTWTFTDGAPVALYSAQPTYKFDNPGIFVVTLNITDAAGNRATDTMTVTVNDIPSPVADAGPDQMIAQGARVSFNGSGSTGRAGIVNYSWTFNDGTSDITLHGDAPSHTFKTIGVHAVTLNVTDAIGQWDIDEMTVTVNDILSPVADAGPDRTVDEDTPMTFDGSASTDDNGIVNCSWELVNGAPVTLYGVRPVYQFDHPGVFAVTLTVMDAAGNRGTDTMTVTVRDITAPVTDAGPDRTVDERTQVVFDGTASSDNVGIANYTWTFDYGTRTVVLYGVSPSFTFIIPGVYHVIINASDAAGSWSEDAMTLTVRDITPPVANAGRDQRVLAGSTVVLNGALSKDNHIIGKYYWNFTYNGKAQSLDGENVPFRFDKAGVYEIILTVIDEAGNRGEDRVVVAVEPTVDVDEGGLRGLPWMPVLLMALAVAGLAGYLVMRKRKAVKGGPSESLEELAK